MSVYIYKLSHNISSFDFINYLSKLENLVYYIYQFIKFIVV